MNSSSTLFRVFDVAFFVPGILLLTGLWYLDFLPLAEPLQESSVAYVVAGFAGLAGVYTVGLFLHGVLRLTREILHSLGIVQWRNGSGPWYSRCQDETRDSLAVYFWYTGATCWNLSVVAALLFFLSLRQLCACQPVESSGTARTVAFFLFVAAPVFYWLGNGFERARESASQAGSQNSQEDPADAPTE